MERKCRRTGASSVVVQTVLWFLIVKKAKPKTMRCSFFWGSSEQSQLRWFGHPSSKSRFPFWICYHSESIWEKRWTDGWNLIYSLFYITVYHLIDFPRCSALLRFSIFLEHIKAQLHYPLLNSVSWDLNNLWLDLFFEVPTEAREELLAVFHLHKSNSHPEELRQIVHFDSLSDSKQFCSTWRAWATTPIYHCFSFSPNL